MPGNLCYPNKRHYYSRGLAMTEADDPGQVRATAAPKTANNLKKASDNLRAFFAFRRWSKLPHNLGLKRMEDYEDH